jgi:molybdopterin-guanine dinucleotide biosynthesis protein A
MMYSTPVVGLILAGGLARRMGGGDKCLLPLAGKTLLQRTIERAQPQVDELILNANGSSLRFARMRLPVIADQYADNPGPLAGIHAGLAWLNKDDPDGEWLVSFASDTPFFPKDLVPNLLNAALEKQALIAVAVTSAGMQPTFSLWHASLLMKIDAVLRSGEIPRLQDWISQQKHAAVEFDTRGHDPFFNINTPQDLYLAESRITQLDS